eukprot:8362976-Pyramimonas_sp.AAC.1
MTLLETLNANRNPSTIPPPPGPFVSEITKSLHKHDEMIPGGGVLGTPKNLAHEKVRRENDTIITNNE